MDRRAARGVRSDGARAPSLGALNGTADLEREAARVAERKAPRARIGGAPGAAGSYFAALARAHGGGFSLSEGARIRSCSASLTATTVEQLERICDQKGSIADIEALRRLLCEKLESPPVHEPMGGEDLVVVKVWWSRWQAANRPTAAAPPTATSLVRHQ